MDRTTKMRGACLPVRQTAIEEGVMAVEMIKERGRDSARRWVERRGASRRQGVQPVENDIGVPVQQLENRCILA